MILLHIVLFVGALLPAMCHQENARVVARLNEVKARTLANRAKARANAQRLRDRLRQPTSLRSKRQHIILDDTDAVIGKSLQDFSQEPYLLHVCPLEKENEYETFPRSGEDEASLFPRRNEDENGQVQRSFPTLAVSPESEASRLTDEQLQLEDSLDEVVDQLIEARDKLERIEEGNQHNSFFPRTLQNLDGTRVQRLRGADADAQVHTFLHTQGFIPQTHSFIPQTHVVPGFQVNQHQPLVHNPLFNQGVISTYGSHIPTSHGLLQPVVHNPLINQGIIPIHGTHFSSQGILQPVVHSTPLINQRITPTHGIIPTTTSSSLNTVSETAPTPHLRTSGENKKVVRPQQGSSVLVDQDRKFETIRESENDANSPIPETGSERESVFDPFNQVDEVMDFLSKHRFRQTFPRHYTPEDREADPTIHKLKKLKMMKAQKYQPNSYPVYQNPGYYREAEDAEKMTLDEEDEEREADPTIHKLKKLKMLKEQKSQPNYYPSYSSYGYQNLYREGEEIPTEHFQGDSHNLSDEEREADPTIHKLKKLKMLKEQKLQPNYYPEYSSYYEQTYPYREAEEMQQEDFEHLSDEEREADPTIHKLKKLKKMKPQYYQNYQKPSYYYRQVEDPEDVSSPSLINFPMNRERFYQFKRSLDKEIGDIVGKERQIINSLENHSKQNEVADIDEAEKEKERSKRSIPLMRLISDPNVRLDVPQTIENFGTATKHAFEDERAPMYHFKNLVGSSKNALLSAMRIPPHNMIVPSDYEIVKANDRLMAVNPSEDDDPLGFSRTFKRVGHMVRESIKSGQETATHIGDIAHNARNILNSARHAAPRLIIPYSQIPAIQDSRRRAPSKAVLITPRIVDLAQTGRLGQKHSEYNENLVKLGHIMDAVGLSEPNAKKLELQKIIFEPRRLHQAKTDARLAHLYSRFRENFDEDKETVSEALNTLEDAKISVGAKSLRDFLVKMKNELTSMVQNRPNEHKKKHSTLKKKKEKVGKEMGMFVENLFDRSEAEEKNETVGAGLYLAPELFHPFMGRASDTQLKNLTGENENIKEKIASPSDHYHKSHESMHEDHSNSNLGYVLGAINPLMLERMYNQSVGVKDKKVEDPEALFGRKLQDSGSEEKLGTVMTLNRPMLKPFMGQAQPQAVDEFLETYNGDERDNFDEQDK